MPQSQSNYNKNQPDLTSNQMNNNELNKNISPYISEIHPTSQRHKTPCKDYKINPNDIPRPNQNDEIYINSNSNPIYETNMNVLAPHSISYYKVIETNNSSCRFIRPTMTYIPPDQKTLIDINLLFGLCVQPFAEIPQYEEEIPKVEANEVIFRCSRCNSYINNKYRISYNKNNKQVIICNICEMENEFDPTKPGVKSEYFNTDLNEVPELSKPTVDFIAPKGFSSSKNFYPHYIFMIDISQVSINLGLPNYILDSIQTNFDYFHNMEQSHIAISLYDIKNIYFFYSEKNDIRISIMSDLNDPFCSVSIKKLFFNIKEQKEDIEKLIERINIFINERTEINENKKNSILTQISVPTGSAIKAGIDSLLENGGRVMIFTPNPCNHGFAACVNRESFDKNKEPDKRNLLIPQHNKFSDLINTANENRIVVDQFIFLSTHYDLSTMSLISCGTGGSVEYYPYTTDPSTINSLYEKLHYDITRIVSRPNYYDCKFMIRFPIGIDCVEILGGFNKKLGEAFQLGGCDPDFCYFYNLRINETFKSNTPINFQIVCLYLDNFNQRYLRIFNSTFQVSTEITNLFNFSDVDALVKAILLKEINLIYKIDLKEVRANLQSKIINSFAYYRKKVKKGSPTGQLILPLSIRYLPLYIDSFLKKGALTQQKNAYSTNYILSIILKINRAPLYTVLKLLYPKFYRIEDIINDEPTENNPNIVKYEKFNKSLSNIGKINPQYNIIQKPYLIALTKDNIDFDSAFLIDDGNYITLIIFEQIDSNFYQELFGCSSYYEVIENGIITLDENNQSELNTRILNIISQLRTENLGYFQPIRILFLTERDINNPKLTSILIEDKVDNEVCYPDYLCAIHNAIQQNLYN